jgi:hypothetical protein
MNLALHQIAEGLINQAVARDRCLTDELPRDDGELIVPTTARRAGVAGMLRAIVDDVQAVGLQTPQPLLHKSDGIVQGSAFR